MVLPPLETVLHWETDAGQQISLGIYEDNARGMVALFVAVDVETETLLGPHKFPPYILYNNMLQWYHIEQQLRELDVRMINPPPANLSNAPA